MSSESLVDGFLYSLYQFPGEICDIVFREAESSLCIVGNVLKRATSRDMIDKNWHKK